MNPKRDNSRNGDLARDLAVIRLKELRFDVWGPCFEGHETDIAVVSNGTIVTIQVKSAAISLGGYQIKLHSGSGKQRHRYTEAQANYFIGVCMGPPLLQPAFYVLPYELSVPRQSVKLFPHLPNKTGLFEMYREKFSLIRQRLGDIQEEHRDAEKNSGRGSVMDKSEIAFCQGILPFTLRELAADGGGEWSLRGGPGIDPGQGVHATTA